MSDLMLQPISAAGLLVTDWCSARCRHCYVESGPEGVRWMTVDAAAGHFAALVRLGVPAEGVHVGGGEPFGDFGRLLAIVRAARPAGLDGVGYVETNGFWADDRATVRDRLAALAEAGMRQVSISADPYHQEFVPPDRVRLLYDVAREVLGPRGVRVRRWKWLKEGADVSRLPEAERLHLFREFLTRYPERMTGRAAECLAPLAERRPIDALPRDNCTRALLASGHVHIDPAGWVYPGTCAGITLGRATLDHPLDAVIPPHPIPLPLKTGGEGDENCHPSPPTGGEGGRRPGEGMALSPLIAALAEGGPAALAAEGFVPDPAGYAGKCHLCWAVRRHLARQKLTP